MTAKKANPARPRKVRAAAKKIPTPAGIPESRLRADGSKITKSWSVSVDLAEWLRERAYLDRQSESSYVEEALRQFVKRWKG